MFMDIESTDVVCFPEILSGAISSVAYPSCCTQIGVASVSVKLGTDHNILQ